MSRFVGLQIRLYNHYNVEQIRKGLMPQSHLVYLSLDTFLDRRGL
jgi:hypothetical protein